METEFGRLVRFWWRQVDYGHGFSWSDLQRLSSWRKIFIAINVWLWILDIQWWWQWTNLPEWLYYFQEKKLEKRTRYSKIGDAEYIDLRKVGREDPQGNTPTGSTAQEIGKSGEEIEELTGVCQNRTSSFPIVSAVELSNNEAVMSALGLLFLIDTYLEKEFNNKEDEQQATESWLDKFTISGGAKSSAVIFSIIRTVTENGLDPLLLRWSWLNRRLCTESLRLLAKHNCF